MRRQPRQNVQAAGPRVGQDFSTADLSGNAYPKSAGVWTPRTIDYVARYGWTLDSDGIPQFGEIAGTFGPLGGLVRIPADSGTARKFAQWGMGGIPCMVTNVSPLKVRVIYQVSGGSPYVTDTSLGEMTVVAPTSYTATVGDPGTLMQGSDLQSEQFVFLPYTTAGGGGGGGGGGGYYGDGSDGALTLAIDSFGNPTTTDPYTNSTASPFGFQLGNYNGVTAGRGGFNDNTGTAFFVFTLFRDIYCTTFTVPATVTFTNGSVAVTLPVVFYLNGHRVFCTVSCTINGSSKITGDGWLYSGGKAGPGLGGSGSTGSYVTATGITWMGGRSGTTPIGTFDPFPQQTGNSTGSGQSAGTGSGYAGVPPTGVGQSFHGLGPCRNASTWLARGVSDATRAFSDFAGGCAGVASGNGNNPGGGGAPVFVAAPTISGAGSITSDGGRGLDGVSANQPGGGGGNPGPVYLIGETISVTTSSAPGAGGTGNGSGANGGAAGGAGLVRKYKPSTDTYS